MKPILLALVLVFVVGCNGDSAQFTKTLNDTRAALVESQKQIADLKTAAEALPPGKTKDEALSVLAKAETTRAILESKVASVEALNLAAKTGDSQGVGAAISSSLAGIPVVGPYASLIGIIAGIGFGFWERSRRQKEVAAVNVELATETQHLSNVVKSLEVAGPDWSEADKTAVKAVQGPATTLRVDELKTETKSSL